MQLPRRRAGQHRGAFPAARRCRAPNLAGAHQHARALAALENGRCVGVRAESAGQVGDIRCEREVILCGGHVQFAAAAAALGHRRAGGSRAAWHPRAARAAGRRREPAGSPVDERGVRRQRRVLLRQPAARSTGWRCRCCSGRCFATASSRARRLSAQGLVRTAPHLDRPDLQMLVAPVSIFARPWFPRLAQGGRDTPCPMPACCCIRRAAARSSLRSADPRDKPKIQLNLLQAEADRDRLAQHRQIRAPVLCHRAGLAAGGRRSSRPGPQVQSDAEIDAWLRANVRTAMHPTSTCAMGTDAHGGGGWSVTSSRVVGIAHRRCVDNAGHRRGQYQCADHHDCGKGGRPDPGRA